MAYVKKIWKDYPDTTTQIKAEDLNNIENGIETLDNVTKYITATAGSNGDYKVNIENTLATNMIVYIYFPAATANTQNARLSIDNGSNYKNIKFFDSTQVLASEIETTYQRMYYNGTDIILLNESYSRTNTNGTYVRYKDGTMICRNRQTINSTINTAWGSIYISATKTFSDFPSTFYAVPEMEISSPKGVGSAMIIPNGNDTTTTKPYQFSLVAGSNIANGINYIVSYIAVGRWKA